jgi:hypothetical protein
MPQSVPFLFRKAAAALGGMLLAACTGSSRAVEQPDMPPTPVIGHVDAPPQTASLRVKGALYGHADLKPRRTDYEPEFARPDLGHPGLAKFSLYDERGALIDSVAYSGGSGVLSEQVRDMKPAPQDDPAFAAYQALPVEQRQLDLLVYVQSERSWRVPEYKERYNGSYIVHFAPASTGAGTDIQIIGYASRARTGSSFKRITGGDGLTIVPYRFSADLVPVAPSLFDRQALLAVLVRLAATDFPA